MNYRNLQEIFIPQDVPDSQEFLRPGKTNVVPMYLKLVGPQWSGKANVLPMYLKLVESSSASAKLY